MLLGFSTSSNLFVPVTVNERPMPQHKCTLFGKRSQPEKVYTTGVPVYISLGVDVLGFFSCLLLPGVDLGGANVVWENLCT